MKRGMGLFLKQKEGPSSEAQTFQVGGRKLGHLQIREKREREIKAEGRWGR